MTVSDTDVELVYAAMRDHDWADVPPECSCGYSPTNGIDWWQHRIAAGLAALSAAGRLVPEGSETRDEFCTIMDRLSDRPPLTMRRSVSYGPWSPVPEEKP